MPRLLEEKIAKLTREKEELMTRHEEQRAIFEEMKAYFDQLPGTTLATVEAMQAECDRAHEILMRGREEMLTLMQRMDGGAVGERAA